MTSGNGTPARVVDVAAWLDDAKPAETIVPVCLRGDLLAEFDRLDAELTALDKPSAAASLDGGGPKRRVAEQIEALRERMTAASMPFRLHALPRRRWTDLIAAHQPRPGNALDEARGVNLDTFLRAIIVECTVEPTMTAEQWTKLLDETLNDAQFGALADAAWTLNRRTVDVPFSRAASRILSTSGND